MNRGIIIKFDSYTLQPADVIVARRRDFSLFDHYLVYMGDGQFVAHMREGVKRMSIDDLNQLSETYVPVRMRQFIGRESERQLALVRANACLHGKYNLLFSNCEHFADYVQYNRRTSLQSQKAAVGLIGVGAVMSAESKSDAGRALGGLSIIAGVLTLMNEAWGDGKNQVTF